MTQHDDDDDSTLVQVTTWLSKGDRQRIKIAAAVLGVSMQTFQTGAMLDRLTQVEDSIQDLPKSAS